MLDNNKKSHLYLQMECCFSADIIPYAYCTVIVCCTCCFVTVQLLQHKVSCFLCLSSDCPADGRTWVPFQDKCYHFVHGEEDSIKSYTFERAKSLCQGFGTWCSLIYIFFFSFLLQPLCILSRLTLFTLLLFPGLLTILSAEENDFVIKYSPQVWKGNVNVWLGMYYDTDSKYHMTGEQWKHAGQCPSDKT